VNFSTEKVRLKLYGNDGHESPYSLNATTVSLIIIQKI
jgi:hypothetical protein